MPRFVFFPTPAGGGGGGSTLPLDVAAWSGGMGWGLRKMRAAHAGGAAVIRRSSDAATMTLAFSGDAIDSGAVETWLAGAHGDVASYVQQGSSGPDLAVINTTRHRLFTSGTLNVEGGLPVALSTGANAYAGTMSAPHTGTTVSALYVGAHGSYNYEKLLSVSQGGGAGFSSPFGAELIGRVALASTLVMYRNSAEILTLASAGDGVLAVMGNRLDGSAAKMHRGATSATGSTSGAFAFDEVIIQGQASNDARTDASSKFRELVMKLSDVGDTAMSAAVTAERTYWGL